MELNIFYHIFVNEHLECLEIIKEQVNKIISSKIYDRLNKIYCCLSGNDQKVYNLAIDYIESLPCKFKLEKVRFNDKSYERMTFGVMKTLVKEDSYYLYLHSKGVRHIHTDIYENRSDWRRCMEYFLVEHAEKCVEKLNEGHTTVGILYSHSPKPHYSGNFWWATGKYLIDLFQNGTMTDDYLGPEMFPLSIPGNPCNMASYYNFSQRGIFYGFNCTKKIERYLYSIYD